MINNLNNNYLQALITILHETNKMTCKIRRKDGKKWILRGGEEETTRREAEEKNEGGGEGEAES